ncbi:MAG: LacI family DNA-binding transcriptional regulator, partial [Fibrobacteres bacterium]|nr:LacI family DNA-binding transcriptional regulator [Fibrobacterota bacterium]
MAARLSDVAKALDINASTVSRALRDDPRVNEKTREIVKQQAEEMGYRPNLIARSLAEGKTRTVWMIVPSLSSPIEREPAEFAASALFDAGYDMLIAQHRNDSTAYKRLLNRLNEG